MDLSGISKKGRFAIIIPAYNHEHAIEDVINASLKLNFPVFVVDDGSTDSTYARIKSIRDICLLQHPRNEGKGAAILTGFAEAVKIADWAITIDADGQHIPEDALNLIEAIPEDERPFIVGMREGMLGKDVPWTSRFGRKFSNFWVLLSGGPKLKDSQSGFRIYPLPEAIDMEVRARRYQFEVEILVKAKRHQIPVVEAPVRVNYMGGTQRISHFRPLVDVIRNTLTFAVLIIERIFASIFRKK
ncbi:MAG: glycosyltransferase family 2 protein [Desulfobacterales bacterium]|nr:glycosyltransferase family 2 protein [Desulfobacterales bacterium]